MSQPPNFSFYNSSAVEFSPTVQFQPYGVQPFPTPQHNPYPNQYHYNTPAWCSYPPSPVQTSHLQSRPQSPQLYGNINNSYISPRRQSSALMIISPNTAQFKKKSSVRFDEIMVPRTQPSLMVSASTFVSSTNLKKDTSSSTNFVCKSPNSSQIFLERARKLGIVCSRSETPDDTCSETSSFNSANEILEQKNKISSLYYHDGVVIDKESAENMLNLFSSVARKLTTDVICSAVIELNAEYGISIDVDDFLLSVDNLLDGIDDSIIRDEIVIENLEANKQEAESNLEKLSSVTSSQTSLLNPDTPEFKPLNVEIMDSMYLPFQTIPISPDYPEQNANYNNSIHTESYMTATRNTDFMDVNSYWEEMVSVETQTVVEMYEKATITEFIESQTVQVERQTTSVQTDLPVVADTVGLQPKIKSKNKKLQTDPEMFPVKSSDPNYRYMKMLEKEVYHLRSQMCLIEIQKELHELQSTKSRWTEFFTPRHVTCNGLNDMLNARVNWLQQCHINIKTQLESGIARLDTGIGLKQLPEPIIYIPTANGNQAFIPKTVMFPTSSQLVRDQQASNQEPSIPEEQQTNQKDNLESQLDTDNITSADKQSLDETTNFSSSIEIYQSKEYSITNLKDIVVSAGSSEDDASNKVQFQPTTEHLCVNELNNNGQNEYVKESIRSDLYAPENSSVNVNVEKCTVTSKELGETEQAVYQTSVMASGESNIRTDQISDVNLIESNNANVTNLLKNPVDNPVLSEDQSCSKTPICDTLTSEHAETNLVYNEDFPLEHDASKLNLSLFANLDVKVEMTEIKEEATIPLTSDDTEEVQFENVMVEVPEKVEIDTHVLEDNRSTNQPQLSVKVEDIPLPASDAERKEENNAEQGNTIEETRFTKTSCLDENDCLGKSSSDCPENKSTLLNVIIPNMSVSESPSFPVEINPNNKTHDHTPKQNIHPVMNKDLLKAVTTQLVHDYPNLLSNPDYLQKLADNQTLLLQSYLDQKTNPRIKSQTANLDTSLQRTNAQAIQQSNCSSNQSEITRSPEFVQVYSPDSSRSNSPIHFLQPSNINQATKSFPVTQAYPSANFTYQKHMLPHSQQILLKPIGPYEQQVPVSNSTLKQQYIVNANVFRNPYSNPPMFGNAQNVTGLYPIRPQNPLVPPTVLSTTNPQFSYPVTPTSMHMNNIQTRSKLIYERNTESTADGSDGRKDPILPDRQPVKEQTPPLSIKSYLVQRDKAVSTKRKQQLNTNGIIEEEDSQSMDTSSETLHNVSFTKPEISETLSYQLSSNEIDTLGMNTLDVSQRSTSFVDRSGYMSDCNIHTKVKDSSFENLQHDNTGYMSDSGFKSIQKTSSAPGFQYKTKVPTVTTASLSGANGFQNGQNNAHGNLLSLSFNSDVNKKSNSEDNILCTDMRKPIKTIVQQPEVLHTRSEKKSIDTDMKSRKRNKTTSDVSEPCTAKPLPMFQTNASQDDWDLEADPYPTTFKFKTDSQKSLNFGTSASDMCKFDNKAVQPNLGSVPKTVKKAGLKTDSKVNTQFLGRLLRSTESSNKKKNSKAKPQVLSMTASIEEIDEEKVDEWQTVPKKIKKAKPEVVSQPPKPIGKKKKAVKEDAAFTRLIELMIARIPNTNRDDAIYIIGEIRKKKGTLKGIPLKNIIDMGTTIMSSKAKHQIVAASKIQVETHLSKDLHPRFRHIMEQSVTQLSLPKSYEEDDVCVICCDELSAERTKALDCGHEFHSMCINEWVYKHERTCPTCRQIALFPEEFPALGAG